MFSRTKRIRKFSKYKQIGTKILCKQADIDKILKIIQQIVLKGTHLPIMIKDTQAGYLISSYFKDIYLYLAQNKLPSAKSTI